MSKLTTIRMPEFLVKYLDTVKTTTGIDNSKFIFECIEQGYDKLEELEFNYTKFRRNNKDK